MVMVVDAAGVGDEDVRRWAAGLEEIRARLSPHFARRDARERATQYIRALVSPVERKNGWQLAEIAGDRTPYGMQHLLGRAVWDVDLVRDALQEYVVAHLGDDEGMLILDETSFPKKGTKSAGVSRQYCGSLGKRENCQVGVVLAYAGPGGCAFIDRELYLPKAWTEDLERRREAGIPEEVPFLTKPEIGRLLLERALDGGTPAAWVLGDEIYGGDYRLRACVEDRHCRYVLGVAAKQSVWVGWEQQRVDAVIRNLAASDWLRLSCGDGTKGPRVYDWTRVGLNSPVAGWERWALCRRSISEPQDLAYYLVFVPNGTPLAEIARAAGSRWHIEEAIAEAKGEVGLDHYEVRSWPGWYRHLTLALLAHAYLVVTRSMTATPEGEKGGVAYPTGATSLAAFRRRQAVTG
jgi:SRSO17 transposase